MARFLRGLFRDKSRADVGQLASRRVSSHNPLEDFDSQPDFFNINTDHLIEHIDGCCLNTIWKQYMSPESQQNEETREKLLTDMIDTLRVFYSSRYVEANNWNNNNDTAHGKEDNSIQLDDITFKSDGAEEVGLNDAGHPLVLMDIICMRIFHRLRTSDTSTKSDVEIGLFQKDLSIDHLYKRSVSSNTNNNNSGSAANLELYGSVHRVQLVECMEILPILLHWPKNMANIRIGHGKAFYDFFVTCYGLFVSKLVELSARQQSQLTSGPNQQQYEQYLQDIYFTLHVLLILTRVFSNSLLWDSYEFYDYLPSQPWTIEETNALLVDEECIARAHLPHSHLHSPMKCGSLRPPKQPKFPCCETSSSNESINVPEVTPQNSPMSPPKPSTVENPVDGENNANDESIIEETYVKPIKIETKCDVNQLRKDNVLHWKSSGCLEALMGLWRILPEIRSVGKLFQHHYSANREKLASFEKKQEILSLIIAAEILNTLSNLFFIGAEVVASCFDEDFSVNRLLEASLLDQSTQGEVADALRIRMQLLCLRINYSLMQQRGNQSREQQQGGRPTVMKLLTSYNAAAFEGVLSPIEVAKVLLWYQTKYQANWIQLAPYFTKSEDSNENDVACEFPYIISFNYPKSVGKVNAPHDLWPWDCIMPNNNSNMKLSTPSSDEASPSSHDFHILHPHLIVKLKKVAKQQTVYMLWDAVIGELMRSQALSSTRLPPPVPDLSMDQSGTNTNNNNSQRYHYLQQQDHDCKLTKPILRYIFQVFQQLFIMLNDQSAENQMQELQTDEEEDEEDEEEEDGEDKEKDQEHHAPKDASMNSNQVCYVSLLGQMKFIDFITELFKAADASDIFSVFEEFDVLQLFLDDSFLSSYRSSSCLRKLTARLKDLVQHEEQDDVALGASSSIIKKLTFKQLMANPELNTDNSGGCAGVIGWLLLQTTVMDLFHSFNVYSIYFQSANDTIASYLSYEDLMLQLTEKMLGSIAGLTSSDVIENAEQQQLTSQQQSSASICIYQLAKLLMGLQEIVLSTGSSNTTVKSKLLLRNQVVRNLLDIVELLSYHSIIHRRIALEFSSSPEAAAHETWVIDAASAASTQAMVYLISTIVEVSPQDWLDIFVQDDRFRVVDLPKEFQALGINRSQQTLLQLQQRQIQRMQEQQLHSSIRTTLGGTRFSDVRLSVGSMDMHQAEGRPVVVANRERDRKLHSSIGSLLVILLNERFYLASLQVMQAILLACGQEVYNIDKATSSTYSSHESKEVSRQRKYILRNLVSEVMVAIMMLVAASYRLSPERSSIDQVLAPLNVLIHLLRHENYSVLRLTFQEFLRRENILKEILRAFAKCMNGFDLVKQKLGVTEGIDAIEKDSSKIMRSCLSLLTAAVCGNESCKHVLSLLLHANRGKAGTSNLKISANSSSQGSSDASVAAKTATGMTSLILCGESNPSKETIVVILDLILDGSYAGFEYLMRNGNNSAVDVYGGESDRAVEAMFLIDVDRPKIHNFAVLPDYFHLIPHCSANVQHFALESFKNLISGRASLVNLNVCSNSLPKVLDIALDLFPYLSDAMQSTNAEIVERLGRHSISVATLKHLFRTLQQQQNQEGIKRIYSWRIVKALQGMFLHDPGPNHTFVFDGNGSGLKLPMVYKWPTNMKGFGFCCWIKVESPKQRDDQRLLNEIEFVQSEAISTSSSATASVSILAEDQQYQPYIYSLRDDNGAGLALILKRISGRTGKQSFRLQLNFKSDTLVPTPSPNANRKRSNTQNANEIEGMAVEDYFSFTPDSDSFIIREDKWYFVGISLTPISYYSKGEAMIVVNHQVARQEFHYTKLPDNVLPLIGDCSPMYGTDNPSPTNSLHSLRGQMGAIYFFSDSLDEVQLRSICSLGPDYLYNFEASSADYKDRSTAVSAASSQQRGVVDNWWKILEDGVLTSKILLTYNPIALRGNYFLDNTPSTNDVRWKVPQNVDIEEELRRADASNNTSRLCKMHALRLSGTYRSSIQAARFALNSLGGIRAIIPMFGQVDQGLSSDANGTVITPSPSNAMAQELNFFPAVLGLFTTILEASIEYKRSFHRCGGFHTVRYLLDRVSPVNFNKITLYQMIELFSKLTNEMILQDSLLETILCDFKLWANSVPEVQCHLIEWLSRLFQNKSHSKNMFPQALSVQRLVDTLYQFYDYEVATLPSLLPVNRARSSSSQSNASGSTNDLVLMSSIAASNIKPAQTSSKKIRLSSVDFEGMVLIRSKMFDLIKVSLQNRTTADDMVSIMKYLSLVSTNLCRQEVLIFILDIMTNIEFKDRWIQLVLGILKGNCINLLEHVLLVGSEEVQLLVLSLYSVLLYQMNKFWTALASLYIKFIGEKSPLPSASTTAEASPGSLKKQHQAMVTSPSNFMQGSGLMQNSIQLLNSACMALSSSKAIESSLIFHALYEILHGQYPHQSLDFAKKVLGMQISGAFATTTSSNIGNGNDQSVIAFVFPFVYFVILNFICTDQSHSQATRLQELTKLSGMLTPFVCEQLLGVWGWQDLIISSLSSLCKIEGIQTISPSVSLLLDILSQLVVSAIKLGNVADYNYVLSPEMSTISLDIQCEVYGRITCGERSVGMTVVREMISTILKSSFDSVEDRSFVFQAFLIYNVLAHCVGTTKTLVRQYHSSSSKLHDPEEFHFVQRRSIWLLGAALKEFMSLIEHRERSSQIQSHAQAADITDPWIPLYLVFTHAFSQTSPAEQSTSDVHGKLLIPLFGQLVKGYLEFVADFKADKNLIPIVAAPPAFAIFCHHRSLDSYAGKFEQRDRNNSSGDDEDGRSKKFVIGSVPWTALHLTYQFIAWSIRVRDHHLQVAPLLTIVADIIEYYESVNPSACLFERIYFCVFFSVALVVCPEIQSCTVWQPLQKKIETWFNVFNYEFSLLAIAAMDRSSNQHHRLQSIQTDFENHEMLEVVASLLEQTISKAQCSNYSRHRSIISSPMRTTTASSISSAFSLESATVHLSNLNMIGTTSIAERLFNTIMTAEMFENVVKAFRIDKVLAPSLLKNLKKQNTITQATELEHDSVTKEGQESNEPANTTAVVNYGKIWRDVCLFIVDFMDFAEEELVPIRMIEFGFLEDFTSNFADKIAAVDHDDVALAASANRDLSMQQSLLIASQHRFKELLSLTSESESQRLIESWKQQDSVYGKYEMKWSRIFTTLANERGPWGYAADSKIREVFWTLDFMETDKHLRFRLKRNPLGSRHRIASLKASGIENADEQAAALSQFGDQRQEDSAITALSNMYAALKKYKNRKLLEQQGGNTESAKSLSIDRLSDDEGEESTEGSSNGNNNNANSGDAATLSLNVEVITAASNSSGGKTQGKLEITRYKISFSRQEENQEYDFVNTTGNSDFLWCCTCYPSTTWMSTEIVGVYRRFYQLRFVALEIFFLNRSSIFINCFDKTMAKRAYRFLIFLSKAPNMKNLYLGKPQEGILKACVPTINTSTGNSMTSVAGSAINNIMSTGTVTNPTGTSTSNMTITEAWIQRKISNFDYLMYLNFIAGRNYHDLAQYPVFPWILSDYHSKTLDLSNPKIYRKFHLPISAQVKAQQELLADKYEASKMLQDDGIFPYHTGSHYSTSAMVIWYLLRLEPFTSYHVWLQEGNFDRPDRLFYSIEHTYHGCTTNTQDVKELIPEFFYNPEFLVNTNRCDFGMKVSNGQVIDDVILPPWARDAHDFIRIHRDALESEYVSQHLHEWIDLIFGYKQRPPFLSGGNEQCVDSYNVYVHLSYLDAVDLESMKISDPVLYNRTIRQIDCYGQTPCQLFTKEHPKRNRLTEFRLLIWPIASVLLGADTIPQPKVSSRTISHAGASASATAAAISHKQKELKEKTREKERERELSAAILDKPSKVVCYGEFKVSFNPIVFVMEVGGSSERLITIDSNRVLGIHTFQHRKVDNVPPFAMKIDKVALQQSSSSASSSSSSSATGSGSGSAGGNGSSSGMGLGGGGGLISLAIHSTTNMMREKEKEKVVGIPFAASIYLSSSTGVGGGGGGGSGSGSGSNTSSGGAIIASSQSGNSATTRTPMKRMASQHSFQGDGDMTMMPSRGRVSVTMNNIQRNNVYGSTDTMLNPSMTANVSVAGNNNGTVNAPNISMPSSNLTSTAGTKDRIDEHLSPHLFCAMFNTPTNKFLISCGHWDNTFKLTSAENGKLIQSLSFHRDVVTCIATSSDIGNKHWIVAGSKDCTLSIWEVIPERGNDEPVNPSPCQNLYGHDDVVNCVAVNAELDLVVSGSDDGTILVHSLREGVYLRSISVALFAGSSGLGGSSMPSSGSGTGIDGNAGSMAVTLRPGVVRTEESANGSTKVTQVTSNGKDAKAIDEHEDANSPTVGLDLDQVDPPNTGNVAAGDADGGQGHEANASVATAASMNSPQQNAASSASSVASSSADKPRRVHSVLISKQGYIVAYSNDGYVLSSYTLNGRFLRSIIVRERLYSLCLSKDGRVLLTGGEKGVVVLRWVFNLKHADDGARTGLQATIDGSSADDEIGPFSSPIRSMCFTSNERHLVVGLETGEIRVLAQDSEYLRKRLHKTLMDDGFLPT